MKFGVVVFPGSNCDHDAFYVLRHVMYQDVRYLWHKEQFGDDVDCVVLPGGFSYGDYLRTGAIARFSPAMNSVKAHADKGKLVIGICNGFQILCEAGFLPGALIRNRSLQFRCEHVRLRVDEPNTAFTNACLTGHLLRIPIAHGEGSYFAPTDVIEKLKRNRQVIMRYCDDRGRSTTESNPNGSLDNIAGICNERRNVFGLMPHPERASEPILGSDDGKRIFESIVNYCTRRQTWSQGQQPE
ncbi:MAG: phosphoribosylformylglycinamidine synthase subunit PurQ [Verrucomicrobiae bacterium]|nr:phosphoribosylformylglycinamidine synthase subunit PurQ [Verrucomicrobiae bacterium]